MKKIAFFLAVAVMACGAVLGSTTSAKAQESLDNLPLPRWASIAAKEVNMRTGPGKRYPIDWVIKKKNLPVEITREFENWRMVREPDGAAGWLHRSMLTSVRYVLVQESEIVLHANPSDQATAVARLRKGVVARIKTCQPDWCRVTAENYDGWVRKAGLWGVYNKETLE